MFKKESNQISFIRIIKKLYHNNFMKNFPRYKTKKRKKIWNLRYRLYALLVIIVIAPMTFYASDKNIPEAVTSLNYEIVESNILASRLKRIQNTAQANLELANLEELEDRDVFDIEGGVITDQLKRAGINTGFISSRPFIDFGFPVKVSDEEIERAREQKEVENRQEKDNSLNSIIPAPNNPSPIRNVLVYDKYKIRVPIIYTTFADLFEKREDGSFDFTRPLDTDDTNSPVQRKLEQGIVHLAYTPQPGEIGNSYIVGHSSNYSWVDSPFNRVFAPINQQSQPGETFVIFDRHGRELKFRVFEVLKIRDDETALAYKNFPDRRVVTLQTSILGTRNGRIEATHRWLTRGELVLN